MADITMCSGEGCPLKDKCYRYTATKNPCWQSYFMEPTYKYGELCAEFWDNNKGVKDVRNKKHD